MTNHWAMYIPWRKLQPIFIACCTLVAVGLILQVLGLKLVATDNSTAARLANFNIYLWRENSNSTRQLESEECKSPGEESAGSIWCEEILSFGLRSQDVISTFDLAEQTDYSLDRSGRYQLPEELFGKEDSVEDVVNVILVPFSHVDPGYGQTMEDYYRVYVRSILDLMVDKLDQYRNMTFQWAETVFLDRWFKDIDEAKKSKFRELINRGQLEIVTGGWVMPDEALTRYTSLIHQLTDGHQWLRENLGVQPKTSWVNDAFGHSSTFPYILQKSGVQTMVVHRIHQAVKNTLMRMQSLEFFWRPYWQLSAEDDILCNVMPYESYSGVCGPDDEVCSQYDYLHLSSGRRRAVVVDDVNVHRLATQLHQAYKFTANMYKLKTLLLFLGEDNAFNLPKSWDDVYTNFHKLITHINALPEFNMKIKFGTIRDYFKSIEHHIYPPFPAVDGFRQSAVFPVVSGDFFPYSDKNNDYWTGFFSNRPWLKKFARVTETLLHAAEIFSVLAHKKGSSQNDVFRGVFSSLISARRETNLFQHHDAITGTSFPHVIRDLEKRLLVAYKHALNALKVSLTYRISGDSGSAQALQSTMDTPSATVPLQPRVLNPYLGTLDLIIVNQLFKSRTQVVSVVVTKPFVRLKDSDGNVVACQISQQSRRGFLVSFPVSMEPFEIKTITLEVLEETEETKDAYLIYFDPEPDIVKIENMHVSVFIDSTSGSLVKICEKSGRQQCSATNSKFMQYRSQSSGPYVFSAAGDATEISQLLLVPEIKVLRGPVISEVEVNYDSGFVQTFTLYNVPGSWGQGLHVSNRIKLPEQKEMNNTEIILRFKTDVNNDGIFFSDQNGLQLIGRQNDKTRSAEKNYYPMTTLAILEDKVKRFTLHSAQSLGVASLDNGWLEVMLDRVMDHGDGKGLDMGIKERFLTLTEFVIHMEYKSSTRATIEPRYTYPSVSSLILNEQLQNNIITLFKYQGLPFIKPPSVRRSLPCDASIASLRTLVNKGLEPIGTSLILHRSALHCAFPAKDLVCNTNGTFTVKQLLTALGMDHSSTVIEETSLTHSQSIQTLSLCDNILPTKNELRTLLIKQKDL